MQSKISASILSADFGRLQNEVEAVEKAGVDMIHIDVMDGHFVPNITFGAPVVSWLKTDLPFDIHLMIENPGDFLEDFAKALPEGRDPNGEDRVSVHIEACSDLPDVISQVHELGFKASVAVNPDTELSSIDHVFDGVDQVLVMTVHPGYSGQKFIGSCLNKVRALRADGFEGDIEVDGGVDDETAPLCREAGANVLVSASFLFGAEDKEDAVYKLRGVV